MTIDLEQFLAESGIDAATLEQWFAREWITPPLGNGRTVIGEIDAARAVFIRELGSDFGVNDEGIEVVLHLVDQVHALRRALAVLRTGLAVRDGD